jgi:hypothetical protein
MADVMICPEISQFDPRLSRRFGQIRDEHFLQNTCCAEFSICYIHRSVSPEPGEADSITCGTDN